MSIFSALASVTCVPAGNPMRAGGILWARAETTSGVSIAIFWSRTADSAT